MTKLLLPPRSPICRLRRGHRPRRLITEGRPPAGCELTRLGSPAVSGRFDPKTTPREADGLFRRIAKSVGMGLPNFFEYRLAPSCYNPITSSKPRESRGREFASPAPTKPTSLHTFTRKNSNDELSTMTLMGRIPPARQHIRTDHVAFGPGVPTSFSGTLCVSAKS